MADYFKEENPLITPDNQVQQLQPIKIPHNAIPPLSEELKSNTQTVKNTNQLEANILDNIQNNFLYSKGQNLQESLIDLNRAFQLIQKIQENKKTEGDQFDFEQFL